MDNPITHKGAVLKQTRESRAIRLETVHEATKIPMDALRAIEEGYTVRTLSTFYYKGFIKMYSQYLGIHVQDDIADRPKEIKRPPSPAGNSPMSPLKKVPLRYDASSNLPAFLSNEKVQQAIVLVGAILVLFVFVKIVSGLGHWLFPKPPKLRFEQKSNLVKVVPREQIKPKVNQEKKKLPQSKPTVKKAESKAAAPAAAPVAEPKPVPKSELKPVEPKPEPKAEPKPEPQAQTSSQAAPVETKVVSLTVRAKKNSWLQVKVDGVVVFQSALGRGAVESWTAKERIELSGKNLNELEFELNGKLIGSLGKSDRLARKLIVTKDGLSVKK
ncbi:MAG: hypothetical protein A2787_06470 [Omnitrophica WOR_2 bacterium RIFCSPHIGHO2_01_FULL_48_9]|nr:MAG: hypothetical protein A3D10_09215 [Omnitrophica WOR_2 bacterium RIFCSPHIGHO2_02_FULL_48_11]OGX31297.1 MAG: hypothetical protein A2787_06470 [Omnitrophica WOR_2 bacterium RIFCSPHIGHO2_01_FULL_48_9]